MGRHGLPAAIGQAANQPIGFQGIGEPGFRPTRLDTGTDGTDIDFLTLIIEQGQFSARLGQAPGQIADLVLAGLCHGDKVTPFRATSKAAR